MVIFFNKYISYKTFIAILHLSLMLYICTFYVCIIYISLFIRSNPDLNR